MLSKVCMGKNLDKLGAFDGREPLSSGNRHVHTLIENAHGADLKHKLRGGGRLSACVRERSKVENM